MNSVERLLEIQGRYRRIAADLINRYVPLDDRALSAWIDTATELHQATEVLKAEAVASAETS